MRSGDTAFRYGGEEFITISAHVDPNQSGILAARICKNIAAKKQHGSVKRMITCSVGVATALPLYVPLNAESLVKHADEALYEAKEAGRNKVCFYGVVNHLSASEVDISLVNFAHIKKLTGGDVGLQKELYDIFLSETKNNQTVLESVFVSKALKEKAFKTIVSVMHQLKSSAKSIGAIPLADSAERLEFAARAGNAKKIRILAQDFVGLLSKTLDVVEAHLKAKQ